VVRQHPERRHDEPAVERADGQGRVSAAARALLQQLFEPLELALVVAQDERGRVAGQQRTQAVQVAIDPLGREEAELEVHLLVPEQEPRKAAEPDGPVLGRLENVLAPGDVLAQPPRHAQVVLRLLPGPLHLVAVGTGGLLHDERVRGEQFEQRATFRSGGDDRAILLLEHALGRDRQDGDLAQLLQRALGGEIEPADRGDVVAPPLEPGGRRHPEAVDVQDAAPHAELGDFADRGHPAVTHPLERARHLRRRPPHTRGQPEAEPLERRRHQRPLGRGARRGDQDTEPALKQRLD
jgi:hypothetical protein